MEALWCYHLLRLVNPDRTDSGISQETNETVPEA
jgi:hypothetical protein